MTSTTSPLLPGWMLDEVASAGRENLDPDHVARYDAKEDAGAAGEVAFLQHLGLVEDATVIDLGAGTGQFTLAVAPHCARVVAVCSEPCSPYTCRQDARAAMAAYLRSGRSGTWCCWRCNSPKPASPRCLAKTSTGQR